MSLNEGIFREYDIRGIVGKDFDGDLAFKLGCAYADMVKEEGLEQSDPRVAVSYDCRLTSPDLRDALIRGFVSRGISVINCGLGATPQLYYMVVSQNLSGGIQITASHNPGDYNGFKMMLGKRTLSGPDIQRLKEAILDESKELEPVEEGSVEEFDARAAYTEDLISRSKPQMGERKLKVVADGGNGMGGPVGVDLLRALGCEVVELYTEPDGSFPNHHPDPTVLENIAELCERVVAEGADIGIAWDGDADRIGVVDEKGKPIFGDMLLLIYGRQLLREVEEPTIIADVKCSELLFSDLSERGANTVMSKTGHSLIKAKLKELDAELAGEMSGHMFFAHRYFGYDDAIHAAARTVEILSNTDEATSELLSDLPDVYNTPEIRVDCDDSIKFAVSEQAKDVFPEFETNTIDGVRITFPEGWGLVRASNTQPALVMRFEAQSQEKVEEYQKLVEERIAELREKLSRE